MIGPWEVFSLLSFFPVLSLDHTRALHLTLEGGDRPFPRWTFQKGVGPYIADYPEQALLACIVQGWCPKYVLNLVFLKSLLICLRRCTAPGDDLDSGEYIRRSQSHSESLVEEFELGIIPSYPEPIQC